MRESVRYKLRRLKEIRKHAGIKAFLSVSKRRALEINLINNII
jgi:hypothetical protein